MSTDNAWWRSKPGRAVAWEYSKIVAAAERIMRAPPQPAPLFVSYPMWLRLQIIEHPEDERVTLWREELERERLKAMKARLRSGWWPWSAGPKGKLP